MLGERPESRQNELEIEFDEVSCGDLHWRAR